MIEIPLLALNGKMSNTPRIHIKASIIKGKFKYGEVVNVGRNNYVAFGVVSNGKVNVDGCVFNQMMVMRLPCLPGDVVNVSMVGDEAYTLLPKKLPRFEIENIKQKVSAQEVALMSAMGRKGDSLYRAVALQCTSVEFAARIRQALRGIEDFEVITGSIGQSYSKGLSDSKNLCTIRHARGEIRAGFKPTNPDGKFKVNKFQVYVSWTRKKIHCKSIVSALDKTLREISKVMNNEQQ